MKFFTPGPSQLNPLFQEFLNDALNEHVGSISHRSQKSKDMIKNTTDSLRKLMKIPESMHIFFLGSATEAMERICQNLVEEKSFHYVNGHFSKRWYDFAKKLGKTPEKSEVDCGEGFEFENTPNAELICVTHTETSTGVTLPIEKLKKEDALLAVDITSSAPVILNYDYVDAAFFSVQKGFGMPAGLGVLIVNDKCLEKAKKLEEKGHITGTHHSFLNLYKKAKDYQTNETPNMLAIYLLGRICESIKENDFELLDRKARLLYDNLNEFDFAVKNPKFRSKNVVVLNYDNPQPLISKIKEQGFLIGTGYGEHKNSQIRIANFLSHNLEDVEKLLKIIKEKIN